MGSRRRYRSRGSGRINGIVHVMITNRDGNGKCPGLIYSVCVAAFLLSLQGCVGPRYSTRVDEYISFEDAYDTLSIEQPPSFWLQHPELDSLIDLAFERNPNILTAWTRVKQARAAGKIAGAGLFPALSAGASASRSKVSTISAGGAGSSDLGGDSPPGQQVPPTGPGGGPQGGANVVEETREVNQFQSSLTASWEVDLWGRLVRRRLAAKWDAEAAEADALAISISLAARLTETWLTLVAQRQTIDLLEDQLDLSLKFEELTRLRFSQGLTSAIDLTQQKQQVETTRGRLTQTRGREETLQHQMQTMLGQLPGGDMHFDTRTLPGLLEIQVSGVPADLFEHRPDVRAAWLRLKAADARAAAAVLDFLPSLRLSGNLFSTAQDIADLFEEWLWSISANLSQPVFQGGRILGSMRQADAAARVEYFNYLNTALTALREVRDALVLIRTQETYIESLEEQEDAAQKALRLSRERYAQGALPYLQVLTALQSLQRIQQNHIEARRQLLAYHVQLYRAAGGGFAFRGKQPKMLEGNSNG